MRETEKSATGSLRYFVGRGQIDNGLSQAQITLSLQLILVLCFFLNSSVENPSLTQTLLELLSGIGFLVLFLNIIDLISNAADDKGRIIVFDNDASRTCFLKTLALFLATTLILASSILLYVQSIP